ncbi:MAG: tRNA ((37)-N6)-threonylcarbamoyltransferase complex dimerization subunit type 1 TsaB [Pseudomonadota bacterium]
MSAHPADSPTPPPLPLRLLALETSTDTLSVALGSGLPGTPQWQHTGPGGAQASTTLLPAVQALLTQAGWSLDSLDAVVFGRGPGSFTGLRTACAVAQGLAYGAQNPCYPAGLPVLPVDTLLALAQAARLGLHEAGQAQPPVLVALLDARMNELYVASYTHQNGTWQALTAPCLCAPTQLRAYLAQVLPAAAQQPGGCVLAGQVFDVYAAELADVPGLRWPVLPSAAALLSLAPALLATGQAVAARDALPLYVRDQVAQTTAEREARQATTARV